LLDSDSTWQQRTWTWQKTTGLGLGLSHSRKTHTWRQGTWTRLRLGSFWTTCYKSDISCGSV